MLSFKNEENLEIMFCCGFKICKKKQYFQKR